MYLNPQPFSVGVTGEYWAFPSHVWPRPCGQVGPGLCGAWWDLSYRLHFAPAPDFDEAGIAFTLRLKMFTLASEPNNCQFRVYNYSLCFQKLHYLTKCYVTDLKHPVHLRHFLTSRNVVDCCSSLMT